MRITSQSETAGVSGTASNPATEKPRSRFADVLEGEKRQAVEDVPDRDRDEKEDVGMKSLDGTVVASAFAPLAPFSPMSGVASVDAGYGVASADMPPLLRSLIQEIVVQAPPDGRNTVDIQFNSGTLEGLHVRVQKTSHGVDVRFDTASETVSKLLTDNVSSLAQALVQRGYPAPSVSVHRTSGRAGDSRGRHDHGRGQKHR